MANSDSEVSINRKFINPKILRLEAVRLSTFVGWSNPVVTPKDMAATGLYFLKKSDHVQCAFCRGVIGLWEPGDIPHEEHKKHYPRCPLFQKSPTGNIPVSSKSQEEYIANEFIEKYMMVQVNASNIVGDKMSIKYPEYVSIERRTKSYLNWPHNGAYNIKNMAEAGFYSTGISDFATCFSCGGGLFNWNETMSTPWRDHAIYFGHCSFLLACKGQDFVNEHRREEKHPKVSKTLSNESLEIILQHPLLQKTLSLGLPRDYVKGAIKASLEKNVYFPGNLAEALEMVADWQQEDNFTLTPDTPSEEVKQVSVAEHKAMLIKQKRAENEKMETKIEELQRRLLCLSCKKEEVSVLLLPCEHYKVCRSCAGTCSTCPSCSTHVRGTLIPIKN